MASSTILPHTFVALRLPSGTHKVLKIVPDTIISLGKYGSFNTNALLGRPYYLTYEVSDGIENQLASKLRIVSAAELHADTITEEQQSSDEVKDDFMGQQDAVPTFEVIGSDGEVLIRNNRLTVDDPTRQALTMDEIEELKKANTGSGKEIIAKIMESHSALNEKTTFSLAKYTLRKSRKYLKRFTALPLNVSTLALWMLEEKDSARIMSIREETLGLMASWLNVHYGGLDAGMESLAPNGRLLVVDDTGGLVVAALAERMGILYPPEQTMDDEEDQDMPDADDTSIKVETQTEDSNAQPSTPHHRSQQRRNPKRYPPDAMSAINNTITIVHPAAQPNISMLSYFSYDPADMSSKSSAHLLSHHPLHTHLKTINLLQLTNPSLDGSYAEPPISSEEVIATWKSSQRGNYFRKRRRWEQTKRVVDETRAGGFDGLVVASAMAPASILHHTVPLLKGGAPVVVYSPHVEPLTELTDYYSSGRKGAFLNGLEGANEDDQLVPSADFPVDPRLLLAPTVQTARAREWQVLPGRTHPLMTGRGGAEGYLFTATRVLPAEGKVEARGRFAKKRKVADDALKDVKKQATEANIDVSPQDTVENVATVKEEDLLE